MKKNLVLIGFMGTGKTTVGKKISEILSMNFIDSDEEIIRKSNLEINEIFNRYGEDYFRNIEKSVIEQISKLEGYVIATGGGIVKNQNNIERLKGNGLVILLKSSPETIFRNVKEDKNKRPLLDYDNILGRINKMIIEREALYNNAKDSEIIIDDLSIDEVVEKVIEIYKCK